MKPLYLATSSELAESRQFKSLTRLIKAKCTRTLRIKMFKDRYRSISMNSERIGTLLYFKDDYTIRQTVHKLRRSKRLTITQLERWKKRQEAIVRVVLEEAKYYADHPGSIH